MVSLSPHVPHRPSERFDRPAPSIFRPGLKASVVADLLPNLTSYIILMCLRHADFMGAYEKAESLMEAVVQGIKKVRDHFFEVLCGDVDGSRVIV